MSPLHAILLVILLLATSLRCDAGLPLVDGADPTAGWTFDNGSEFPGASGRLDADPDVKHRDSPSLKLTGDFTKGGRYVQVGRKFVPVDIQELSLWLRNPDTANLTLRLIDSSGQVHQIALQTEASPHWQSITLPIQQFFAKRGSADAVPGIAKYESWGGANDSQWHGPATALYLLLGRNGEERGIQSLWLDDITLASPPQPVAGLASEVSVALDELIEGESDWHFTNGLEFKGARGSLTVSPETAAGHPPALTLQADFSHGGAYVAAVKNLQDLDIPDFKAVHLRLRTTDVPFLGVQMVDGTGQTHQQKRIPLKRDGAWHDLVLDPDKIAGGEHWGGANDGKWHGRPKQIVLSIPAQGDPAIKQFTLQLSHVRAQMSLPVFVQPAALRCTFEDPGLDWAVQGASTLDAATAYEGRQSLRLSRSENDVSVPTSATSPAFPVSAGWWDIGLAFQSELLSPDNSYHAAVTLHIFDGAGRQIEALSLATVFGQHPWTPTTKRLQIPPQAVTASFQVQLHKTWGAFRIDDLSAACLAPLARTDNRISRLLFSTAQLGNLLFPGDSRKIGITVETRKPLNDSQRSVTCMLRDYWGAEQAAAVELPLIAKPGVKLSYQATLDLADIPLQTGRYYEIHAAIPQGDGEPFRNHTSFAILPEAAAKQFPPDQIPFTARNWDNRIPEYIRLTDRLGIRICGLWGGWSSKPPYQAEVPGLDLVRQLGMGWLTTTPCKSIEDGRRDYDETALRQGARNLIQQFGDHRPFIINLGNEPHGTGERVRANVEAYRVVYDEIKKTDPSIPVVATSVEPNEAYFQLGYGHFCDAFDFHIYESAENVRRTIGEYKALMKKYKVDKPLWSTELGLNSQGMTRLVVAREVPKKFATFFAAGGANVSWFGLLYPDPDGKSHGSFGDSHNVFDCRYNRYAPRLDALALYHAVNAIASKRFIAESQYPNGIRAFLFQDSQQRSLQILWSEDGAHDITLPLPGVGEVELVRIDGSHHPLHAAGTDLTLTIGPDPVLLLYQDGPDHTAEALQPARAGWHHPPEKISRSRSVTLSASLPENLEPELAAPHGWAVSSTRNGASAAFVLTPPQNTTVREVDLMLILADAAGRRRAFFQYRAPAF